MLMTAAAALISGCALLAARSAVAPRPAMTKRIVAGSSELNEFMAGVSLQRDGLSHWAEWPQSD
jgi:hypothetical protein